MCKYQSFSQIKNLFHVLVYFSIHSLKLTHTPLPINIIPPYLFLISFKNDVSLSYQNSPPAGRGRFTISACVATKTTRRGVFSLPPNAEKETRTLPYYETCPGGWVPYRAREGAARVLFLITLTSAVDL